MTEPESTKRRSGHTTFALLVGIFLSLPGQVSAAQTADSLRSVIVATRARSTAAARVFFDSTRTVAERERAVATVGAFLDSSDARTALRMVGDARQPERIRMIALNRSAHMIDGDSAAESALLRWLVSRDTPSGVRHVAMNTVTAMLVGSRMRARRMPEMVALLRRLSADPDSILRSSALAWLAASGDSATVSRLVRALTPGGDPFVSPVEAVGLIGTSGSAQGRATMRPLLLQRRDPAARTEAIRVLGADPASAQALDRLIADSSEEDTVRAAALRAVFANRPQEFPTVSLPLIADEQALDALRVFAIDAVRLRLRAPSPRLKMAPTSRFDEVVQRLATESASQRVRAAAAAYLSERRR